MVFGESLEKSCLSVVSWRRWWSGRSSAARGAWSSARGLGRAPGGPWRTPSRRPNWGWAPERAESRTPRSASSAPCP
eukprot:3478675-Alexandrium_andersonii.AAC.1